MTDNPKKSFGVRVTYPSPDMGDAVRYSYLVQPNWIGPLKLNPVELDPETVEITLNSGTSEMQAVRRSFRDYVFKSPVLFTQLFGRALRKVENTTPAILDLSLMLRRRRTGERARRWFCVRFVDRNMNCQTVMVEAFSIRHAKKLTRRAAPVRQWLNVTNHR